MKTADRSFHQCFNGQAVVASRTQIIVACEVSHQAPDVQRLEPALTELVGNLARIGAVLPDGEVLTRILQ
jgi:hypothetical protein